MTPRGYIEIGAGIVLVITFWIFVAHERSVGAVAVHTADAKALIAERRLADSQTVLNNERAAKADAGAANEQKIIDDYRSAHSDEQPLRLCKSDNRNGVLPKGSSANASAANPGSGPAALSEVSERGESAGPDVTGELDAIVRAAERLDVLYADRQQR